VAIDFDSTSWHLLWTIKYPHRTRHAYGHGIDRWRLDRLCDGSGMRARRPKRREPVDTTHHGGRLSSAPRCHWHCSVPCGAAGARCGATCEILRLTCKHPRPNGELCSASPSVGLWRMLWRGGAETCAVRMAACDGVAPERRRVCNRSVCGCWLRLIATVSRTGRCTRG
jgi:hypothetical protein